MDALIHLALLAAGRGPDRALSLGDTAPPLAVGKWVKGAPVTRFGHGKVTVVDFWSLTCGPCIAGIPHLTEIARRYKGKVTIASIDVWDGDSRDADFVRRVKAFVAARGSKMMYSVGLDRTDPGHKNRWTEGEGRDHVPLTYIVDQQGKIAWIGTLEGLDQAVAKVAAGTLNIRAEAAREMEEARKGQAQQEAVTSQMQPVMFALHNKDYPEVVKEIDKLVPSAPGLAAMLHGMRLRSLANYDAPAANSFANDLIETIYKHNGEALFQVMYTITEDNSPIQPEIFESVLKIAKHAVAATGNEPQSLDEQAYLEFRLGLIRDAIAIERQAIAGSYKQNYPARSTAEMKSRLATFKAAL